MQAKKVLRGIENQGGGASTPDTSHDMRIAQLEAENEQLQNQVASAKRRIEARQGRQAPAAPPPAAPAPAASAPDPAPSRQRRGPGLVGGAARGAAGGAAKGAIMGAILPGMDASDGAKAGAAVGAMSGGLRGARRRRFG